MKQVVGRKSSVVSRKTAWTGLLTTDDSGSSDKDGDDAGAGLSWSEVGADGFPHGEAVALIATKTNRGRCAVLLERYKRDIHGRSIFADDRSELYKAHRTTHAGNPAGKGATDEDISASRTDQNQANHEER